MAISNNKTSLLVNSQVPEFVRNDHSQFVKFLEKYYEFMEQELGAINVAKNFNDNSFFSLRFTSACFSCKDFI